MNAVKTTSAALVVYAMSASAFAGTDLDTRVHELEKKVDMMSTVTARGTFGVQAASARPEPNGKGWFLTFDVLYWQSKVGNALYAVSTPAIIGTGVSADTKREPKFDWTFAFKAGIGYDFFHDSWDVRAEYTYFRNEGHDNYGVSVPAGIYPISAVANDVLLSVADFATNSYSSLKLRLDDLIVDLGRAFFVSKDLSMRPSLGLKASWITLKETLRFGSGGTVVFDGTSYTGLGITTVYGNLKEELFGLGPRAAVQSSWHLGNDFSIYSNVSGALLFGYFKNTARASYNVYTDVSSTQSAFHRLVPTVDFELGLMYDTYIMCDTQHFSVALGYETQYYWEASLLIDTAPAGIGMYGVNLNLRWDF